MTHPTIEQAMQIALGHHQAGRQAEAEALYRQVLAEDPDHAGALHLLGVLAGQSGHTDRAIDLIGRAVASNPGVGQYHSNLGEFCCRAGQWDRAIDCLGRAITLRPDLAVAHGNLGNALKATGRPGEAIAAYRRALELKPDQAGVLTNLGVVLHETGCLDDALAAYRRALALEPGLAEAWYNLGCALNDAGRFDEAIAPLSHALALRPANAGAHYQLGNALRPRGQLAAAVAAYQRAIALEPAYALAHNNLGVALEQAGRLDEAIAAYHRAIALEPGLAEVHYNLGSAQMQLGELDLAIAAFRQAIALNPARAEAYNNLAGALRDVGRAAESVACFRQAALLNPGFAASASNVLFTVHYDPELDAETILAEHRRWAGQYAEPLRGEIRPHPNDRSPGRRLRVGFVSPDLRCHPVGRSLLCLFRERDRQQLEVVCYSDVKAPDELTGKLVALADRWHETGGMSDPDLAGQIRADRVDILVDPTLHTAHNRLLVFARKPAPVQLTMLGPPTTTGLATMDYRLTDPYLDPPGASEHHYTEQSVRLPHCFWVFPPPEPAPPVSPLPAAQNGFLTIGYLNQFAKLSRPALELWVRILQALPGARLILQAPGGSPREAIEARFAEGGIRGDRLEFVAQTGYYEYLERYQKIDLCLDPFPYNQHTSTLDPLWMGVPVITLAGRPGVGRGGVSMLTNAGLTELIARTPEHYVDLAVAWGTDRERLAALRAGLRERIQASPLLDAPRYTADVTAAFRQMWRTWCES